MPISFVLVCDLLEQAHKQCKAGNKDVKSRVTGWFTQHRRQIDDPSTNASALLSTLLPEKRTDRVYNIQAATLSNIFARSQALGHHRLAQLKRYEKPGSGVDLADCIAEALKEAPNPRYSEQAVTVEEIDAALNTIAAGCRFSSSAVQGSYQPSSSGRPHDVLVRLYRRVQAREAKWLTRLILKNYEPIVFDPGHVYYCYDPVLPKILRVQDDFGAALAFLQNSKGNASSGSQHMGQSGGDLMKRLVPVLGVKVGRQSWVKGRSIKHCMDMIRGRISCEKKVDGEYCQIHIDLSKGSNCIQIFSKSGKDSTADRTGLHGAVHDSLNIGKPNCKISKGAILEGELVVYSDKENKILPFHKIRKHVSRSGSFINTEADSQRHHYEHLMIIYYDVLLIDQESLLGVRHSERFKRLSNLVICRKGHAELVDRQIISLDRPLGASHLRRAFAQAITAREEGLVLKPDDPYFEFGPNRKPYSGCPIKLKKEYIGSFGDVGDFAVVAARYDPDKAKSYNLPRTKIHWTHFYLGCLDNKNDILRHKARPKFTVVHQVELNEALLKTVMTHGRPRPVSLEDNEALVLDIAPGIAQGKMPSVVFTEPLVFDIRCFSFDRQGKTGFWQPRFPQVSKVHFDRSFLDTMSFSELQQVAEDATTAPDLEDSQEMLGWIAALEGADPRGVPVDAVSHSLTSPQTPSRSQSTSPFSSPGSLPRSPLRPYRPLPTTVEKPEPTLITPPTSSSPEIGTNKIAKHPTENIPADISHASKRCRDHQTYSDHLSKRPRIDFDCTASVRRSPSSNVRQPLVDKDANRDSGQSPRIAHPLSKYQSLVNMSRSPASSETLRAESQGSPVSDTSDGTTPRAEGQGSPVPDTSEDILPTKKRVQPGAAEDIARHAKRHAKSQESALPDTSENDDSSRGLPGECIYAGKHCHFNGCFAILSPCLANMPYITEDLLPRHGIKLCKADDEVWSDVSNNGGPGPRKRVAFVEGKRPDACRKFIAEREANVLRDQNGKRLWTGIYDWRALEAADSMELRLKGYKSPHEPNPKRQYLWRFV